MKYGTVKKDQILVLAANTEFTFGVESVPNTTTYPENTRVAFNGTEWVEIPESEYPKIKIKGNAH